VLAFSFDRFQQRKTGCSDRIGDFAVPDHCISQGVISKSYLVTVYLIFKLNLFKIRVPDGHVAAEWTDMAREN
jgi:hypothetical protein